MSSYKELLAQRQALELEIEEARRREMADALAKVRVLVADYALTQEDVFPPVRGARASGSTGNKVAVPFSNGIFFGGNHRSHWAASPASHTIRSAGSCG